MQLREAKGRVASSESAGCPEADAAGTFATPTRPLACNTTRSNMKPKRPLPWLAAAMLILSLVPAASLARIKLITLPVRERVEIQLDHESATLVEEERIVPLTKGENQVDFSWANTQIDPQTIVFRVIAPEGDAELDVKVVSV